MDTTTSAGRCNVRAIVREEIKPVSEWIGRCDRDLKARVTQDELQHGLNDVNASMANQVILANQVLIRRLEAADAKIAALEATVKHLVELSVDVDVVTE